MRRIPVILFMILCIFCQSMSARDRHVDFAQLSFKNMEWSAAFKKVGKVFGCRVIFVYDDVRGFRVNGAIKGETAVSVIKQIIGDRPFACSQNGKFITIARLPGVRTQVSPSVRVRGCIRDTGGEPLAGVSILCAGTTAGATTDINGNFEVSVPTGSRKLRLSYVGMRPLEVHPSEKFLNLTMQDDPQDLEQLMVIGYGELERKRVTTAISTVAGESLMRGIGGSSVATALQGRVAGLAIDGTASPNSSDVLQLRGVSSVKSSNSPLVVIDGIQGADLNTINLEDIESIDVLKDASAAAVYGTRASAGVILITTRKPRHGNVSVTYNAEFSVESVRKRLDMLTPEEYVASGRGMDFGSRTDWYDLMMRDTPFSQRHIVTVNGGSKTLSLYSSLLYSRQEGILIGNGRSDYSARINGRYKTWENRLEIGLNLQYRETHRDNRNSDGDIESTIALNPTIPLMDPDNPLHYNVNKEGLGDFYNPVANIMDRSYKGVNQWVSGELNLKFNILPGFTAYGIVGFDRRQFTRTQYYNQWHRVSVDSGKKGQGNFLYNYALNTNWDAYLAYSRDIAGKHHINATAGWSYYTEGSKESFGMTNSDFTVDQVGVWDMGAGTDLANGLASMSSSKSEKEFLLAWYARLNYSLSDKYMAMGSFRREGSSKFGKNHRWGNFWSLSAGWRLSREPWLANVGWIDELKLRAGYGVTGNSNFDSGYTRTTYVRDDPYTSPGSNEWGPSYRVSGNINPDLKWEEKKEFNVGVDFGFLGNRINGKFDWFFRNVDDMLFSVTASIPPLTRRTMLKNVGSLRNHGWEFEITGRIFQTETFDWSSTLRFSSNISKITNLGAEDSQIVSAGLPQGMGNTHKLINNQQIGKFWLFRTAGVDESGRWLIYDRGGNVVPADGNDKIENKCYVGNGVPKLIFSMNHDFRYRGFDLGIACHSYIDYDVYDTVNLYYGLQSQTGINVLHSAYRENSHIKDNRILCDYFLSDASFFKIDAVSLGYTLDLSKWQNYVKNLRFYLTARDVATFTAFKGYNPDPGITGLFPGVIRVRDKVTMHPQTIHWTLGMQVRF